MRKNLLTILLLAIIVLSSALAKADEDIPFLTHDEFLALPYTDQVAYVKELREAIALFPDLADDVALLDVSPFSLFIERANAAIGSLQTDIDDVIAEAGQSVSSAPSLPQAISIFKKRDAVELRILKLPKDKRADAFALLQAADKTFATVKGDADRLGGANAELSAFQKSHDHRVAKFKAVVAAAPATVPAPASAPAKVASEISVNPPEVASDLDDKSCVRCIYSGFIIRGDQKCKPVHNGQEMTKMLGNLWLPEPYKNSDFMCKSSRDVMCNPLLFGFGEGAALCVPRSRHATRDCSSRARFDDKSMSFTVRLISNNKAAYNHYLAGMRHVCRGEKLCNARANRKDIGRTCDAIHAHLLKFKKNLNANNKAIISNGSQEMKKSGEVK